jgi:hypothetical protein
MDYATTHNTIYQLMTARKLLSKPENWCQGDYTNENEARLDEVLDMVSGDNTPYRHNIDSNNVYPGDLNRGQIPESVWFIRQAMNKIAPEFGGMVFKWNDAPGREHEEVLNLISSAIDLVRKELDRILSSHDGFDISGVELNRWAGRDGSQLCAMTALSQRLGYATLTDIPHEVDPGLAALVNLLNDRASHISRQLLASRLKYIPNTGRTDICDLISRVFFPKSIAGYGYEEEVDALTDCESREELADEYASLSGRFKKPDGVGFFACGCITLSAALNSTDPEQQDLLAVSAVSQLVSFEMGWVWVDLLYILDFIIGLEESPSLEHDEDFEKYRELFAEDKSYPAEIETPSRCMEEGEKPFTEIYDFGIKVQWFPALVEKFPDQLEEIAQKILEEITALDSVTIYMHRFAFENKEVMIVTSWDDDLDLLFADADLVAYMDVVGEIDLEGDGDTDTVLRPVPASEAGYLH